MRSMSAAATVFLQRNYWALVGLKVVAEGAETAEQVRVLNMLKCELVQGYFFANPETTPLLRRF
jgi:EAL domain-containing protein (putative c-di-GMP-specific phosphodiesterase class I)